MKKLGREPDNQGGFTEVEWSVSTVRGVCVCKRRRRRRITTMCCTTHTGHANRATISSSLVFSGKII